MLLKCQINKNTKKKGFLHPKKCLAHTLIALAHTLIALAHTSIALAHTLIALAHTSKALAHTLIALSHTLIALAHTSIALAHTFKALTHLNSTEKLHRLYYSFVVKHGLTNCYVHLDKKFSLLISFRSWFLCPETAWKISIYILFSFFFKRGGGKGREAEVENTSPSV